MDFLNRTCPLCGANSADLIFEIPTSVFVPSNETIIAAKLKNLGLYEKTSGMRLVECNYCQMTYIHNTLSPELTEKYYNECIDPNISLRKMHRSSKQSRYEKLSRLLLEIRNSDEITVFEYGCGWGDFLTKIRGDGVHVIGLELDQRKINFCKSQDIQIVNDLSEIPGPIDIFFCNQVLEHLSDPKGTLLEIKQYLHPKFVGYASVPLYELTELRKMKIATASDKNLNPYEHLNLFSSQTFEAILGSVGFGSFRRIHNGVIFRNCIKL